MEQAERDLRDLLDVPKNYCVLFLQGGASLQFSMVPLNLSSPKDIVDYVITGYWGKKAAFEASLFCNVNIATDAAKNGIGMVYQEQSVLPNLTVAENIYLGQEEKFIKFGLINKTKLNNFCQTNYVKFREFMNEEDKEMVETLKEECENILLNNR